MGKKVWPLVKKLRFFQKKESISDGLSEVSYDERDAEKFYRTRWSHDKVVRTTHGVNCTGSCSWKVFVKEGIITWENQQTDYPSTGPDMPEYEPRGCPRGASFSWYEYSPLRVKYPYIRQKLLQLWRKAREKHENPIDAWQSIVTDPAQTEIYKKARGKGGFVRTTWREVNELIAAMNLYTIKTYGPDRLAGFTPIPAMSMVSYASGARYISLLGGSMLSFYDWYADLPPASPQVWGEQTDVPESGDWYHSSYLMMWGSNVPMTRVPDAHFMTEVRYKGTKVIAVSPDYADNVKFADMWLNVQPGSDGAMAQAMTQVILQEFYVNNPNDYFIDYAKKFTDLPFLVTLEKHGKDFVPGPFLRAQDLGYSLEKAEWKTLIWDEKLDAPAAPTGTMGHRWDKQGKWNLKMEDESGKPLTPRLSLLGCEEEQVITLFSDFSQNKKTTVRRGVPVRKVKVGNETVAVTTVFDLMAAQYGVRRGLSGDYPTNYMEDQLYTPAWQEKITSVKASTVIQVAREFAQNAADTKGRSMIIMGAGINHWFHSDAIYRTILNLVILTGCQGVNGGGWAHYVGQEKCRPIEGWGTIAFARDWSMPPRLQNATNFYYFATDQWRYEELSTDQLTDPLQGKSRYRHSADYSVLAARLGWMPSYPQFNCNTLALTQEFKQQGITAKDDMVRNLVQRLKNKKVQFAVEDPDHEDNFPRGLFVWRSNLISSSGKGHEYFLKHLLGTSSGVLGKENPNLKPEEVKWHEQAPEGKLDLLVALDFRMAGNALYSDIVLPAATWYEKNDLSSTDMHPFVHPFNPAINPPWDAKADWDIFKGLAETVSNLAQKYYQETQLDLVAAPLGHDSPEEIAQPYGLVKDWKKGEVEPIPGQTMPKIVPVERNYTQIYEKYTTLGPLVEKNPVGAHGVSFSVADQYELLKKVNGCGKTGVAQGKPSLETGLKAAEAMLGLSSATNGKLAMRAWQNEEEKTGVALKDISADRAGEKFTFQDITVQPRKVIPTPVFTGSNQGDHCYSPFTTSIQRLVPFRTLTGRQHFYLDHELMLEFGEGLPVYKPTLMNLAFSDKDDKPQETTPQIVLRYLTPHGKWNIHSTYQDNLRMLTLFRGGPNVWINHEDAAEIGVADNDWIEVYNRNGVVTARAVVSHRMPRGSAYMYHAQDKHVYVPGSSITGERGGSHNTPTRIHVKPTQCIGGYAQLSYGFNYYGPVGNQRDIYVVVRKLKEVSWLED